MQATAQPPHRDISEEKAKFINKNGIKLKTVSGTA
jgi:hypothetical protein